MNNINDVLNNIKDKIIKEGKIKLKTEIFEDVKERNI